MNPQSFAYIENATFLACSSIKGGVFFLSEGSYVTVKSSNFSDNFASEGGIFHSIENYNSTITIMNSFFRNNSGEHNLFNIMDSNFHLNLRSLKTTLTPSFHWYVRTYILMLINITKHICNTKTIGCLCKFTE